MFGTRKKRVNLKINLNAGSQLNISLFKLKKLLKK